METKRPEELIKLWLHEDMTIETTIGHILQNLAKLHIALEAHTVTLYHIRSDLDSLAARFQTHLTTGK